MNKYTIQPQPSRQQIASWVHSIINEIPMTFKIQELGKGVIYCRLLNHYFPGVILINRIIWHPKSQYQNMLNLRILQNALAQLKILLPLDPIKLSKEKLNDNWAFIVSFYRILNQNSEETTNFCNYQEQIKFNTFYSSNQTSNNSQLYNNSISNANIGTPKRAIEKLYPEGIYQKTLFFPSQNVQFQNKNIYNGSKYSVGKLYKEPSLANQANNSPNKGKWSVNSHMFQNNLVPIIDRIKEILLKSSNNTEKIRQVKLLLNIPLKEEEAVVKIEQDENNTIKVIGPQSSKKQEIIKTATTISQQQLNKQNIQKKPTKI